jgi:predicted DNA-binding protein (UPF0251 family)
MTKPKPTVPKAPEVVMPPRPWITRADRERVDITNSGLEAVCLIAFSGGSQRLVASELGISLSGFKKLMERDERVRLQYEAGLAEEEAELVRGLRRDAAGGFSPAAMFLLKSRHGYVEGTPAIELKPNITLVLPEARTPEQYLEDLRARERAEQLALPAPEPVPVDVTPRHRGVSR